jgi:hypothetical protein
MSDHRCTLVFRSRRELLWIWDEAARKWLPPVRAVSGGGRGQHVDGERVQSGYGAHGERQYTGRIANMGGALPPSLKRLGDVNPTRFGEIPNGVFRVGHVHQSPGLGRCAALSSVEGAMMGRKGFYIHGQGHVGSEGCIVPLNGQLTYVLSKISFLQSKGPIFLRVEGSVTFDLPDAIPHYA